jgi:anti-sigma regulatory factor (Ser/Thr protein kinase)
MLDREPAASQEARRLVTHACAEWQLDAITPTAQLVVTELVNNAVLHTGDRFLVTVTLTDEGIHVAVRDTSRQQPRVRAPEQVDVYGGKGMTLVEAFAHAWGTTLVSDGKVVWADLRA